MSSAVPRIGRTALAALAAGGALSAFALAPSAEAAFSLQRCTGSDIQGRGATFQNNAQSTGTLSWASKFKTTASADTCIGGPTVEYNPAGTPNGSGAGRGAMGSGESTGSGSLNLAAGQRDPSVRFGGSDEGPSLAAQQAINAGQLGNSADDGRVHVLPVAASAVAMIVSYPRYDKDGVDTGAANTGEYGTYETPCPIPASYLQSDGNAAFDRVRVPNWKLEQAWYGEYSTWGDLLADPDGAGALTGLANHPAYDALTADEKTRYDAGCTNRKLIRAVRQDSSGTTFAFKDFLNSAAAINEAADPAATPLDGTASKTAWRSSYLASSTQNRSWPGGDGGASSIADDDTELPDDTRPAGNTNYNVRYKGELGKAFGDIADATNVCEASYVATAPKPVCRSNASGAGGVRSVVDKNIGAIGYVDLATAVSVNASRPYQKKDAADTRYFLPLAERNSVTSYVEPTANPQGFKQDVATGGANCANVPVTGQPRSDVPTLEPGWDTTTMVFPQTVAGQPRYNDCSLTYVLAFDDNAPVYTSLAGTTYAEEERRARTVKDYLSYIVSDAGQGALVDNDYARVPDTVAPDAPAGTISALAAARKGVASIDWDKAGIGNQGGGQPQPQPGNTPGPGGGGGTTAPPTGTPAPTQQAPVNLFTIGSARKRANDLVSTFRFPGAGRVQVTAAGTYTEKVKRKGKKKATSRKRTVSVGKATVAVSRAGDLSVKLPMSSKARSALKKAKRITVKITAVYTPTGGTARTVTRTLTLRA